MMLWGPSNTTGKVDSAFLFIVSVCVALLCIITFFMILFLVKYNKKRHPQGEEVKESVALEILWTVIPTVLVLLMFYFGWVDFEFLRHAPKNAMKIDVTGRQWSWLFTYTNGKQSDLLKVPAGKPVELILTSEDVIHSLFIPAFRIKEDCVPGMKTHLWFTAEELGSYDIFCTEYCGAGHSHMLSKVIVMPESDFKEWYAGAPAEGGKTEALNLLQAKGCLGCHTTDGTKKIGPSFKGIFGGTVTVMTKSRERVLLVDEGYLKRSILEPNDDIVKGYPPVMPVIPMSEEELKTIVNYIENLR
jgi:cytochrome c oxidase subunit II